MFTYSSIDRGEYEPLGAGPRKATQRAYMTGGAAALLVFCLFAFSGSSNRVATQQQMVATQQQMVAPQQLVVDTANVQAAEVQVQQLVQPEGPGDEVINFSVAQFDMIYNILSFAIACMGSATVFFFFQVSIVDKQFKTAIVITGLVTLIAFYHYIRIFDSFNEAYFNSGGVVTSTGIPFNDAYRYVDWLLTVPLLLTEIIMVMDLGEHETRTKCWSLGSAAALMIILGYPGEITDSSATRWLFWTLAMVPFLYIVYMLFFGLQHSIAKQGDAQGLVRCACYLTVISWCTYPVVYIFPMIGLSGAGAHTAIQVGYSVADVVAKPLTGLLVWMIAARKSAAL